MHGKRADALLLAAVGHVEAVVIRCKAESVWLVEVALHDRECPGLRVEPVDEVARLFFGTLAEAVVRVRKPQGAVVAHGDVVGRIQQLALKLVGEHGDLPISFATNDIAGSVLARDEATLAVDRVAIALLTRLPLLHAILRRPAQQLAGGNVGEDQRLLSLAPHGAFGKLQRATELLDHHIGGDQFAGCLVVQDDRRRLMALQLR